MRAGGGKQKGAAFERKICVALSLWITNGQRKDCLWRSAMSGGRATVGRKASSDLSRQAGDVSSVSPEGHTLTDKFYIEIKHYKSLQLDKFLFGTGRLAKFWQTTCKEANHYKKQPMLIAKGNNIPTLVLTRHIHTGYLTLLKPLAIVGNCEMRGFDELMRTDYPYRAKRVRL